MKKIHTAEIFFTIITICVLCFVMIRVSRSLLASQSSLRDKLKLASQPLLRNPTMNLVQIKKGSIRKGVIIHNTVTVDEEESNLHEHIIDKKPLLNLFENKPDIIFDRYVYSKASEITDIYSYIFGKE